MGDFAHRRLPELFRESLDRWLQQGLLRLRERHADWTARYLEGPLWFFVLGEQMAGTRAWLGLLMPSVDGVGRYFPFLVAAELLRAPADWQDGDLAQVRRWCLAASAAALEGLEQDLDAAGLDAALRHHFDAAPPAALGQTAALPRPTARQAGWFTDPAGLQGLRMITPGWPGDARFDALFGHDGGDWVQLVEAA
ncbi:MAG: type VI secretion system-associated protein TagF [Comamonadaceae bacterium]|nr:MAG: type VI secretion system-associated protein TagF [Comamonadaceae bacterium]